MKLSDVVGHAGLSIYTEIALVLFLLVFVAVLWRTLRPSRRAELEAQGLMPLAPDTPELPRAEATPTEGATS